VNVCLEQKPEKIEVVEAQFQNNFLIADWQQYFNRKVIYVI